MDPEKPDRGDRGRWLGEQKRHESDPNFDATRKNRSYAESAFDATVTESIGDTINNRMDGVRRYTVNKPADPKWQDRLESYALRAAWMAAGAGEYYSQFSTFFRGLDRFKKSLLPQNAEHHGFTFITRPRLNLTDMSIVQDRCFTPLLNEDPSSVPFMIRCLLDSQYARTIAPIAALSDKFNPFSPWMSPVCNSFQGISGWPDDLLYTETSEGGWFQDDQTVVIGGDRKSKTYDLTLTFKDISGGPIMAIFDYWVKWMSNAASGIMVPYADAIDANRLDYTVSIYRFATDPTRRFITKWAKATGCFPKAVPTGAVFNVNPGEVFSEASAIFSIPFVVNHIGSYNDPIILTEFNQLADRYAGTMWLNDGSELVEKERPYAAQAINNFCGLPYIVTGTNGTLTEDIPTRGRPELIWRRLKEEAEMFLT